MKPVFFTIVSRNYLAYALTLMQSIARQYPDATRYLCLADARADDPALDTDLFETVTIDALGLPDFDAFVFRYGIMELNTAVKPYMFAWVRARHHDAGIVYLDPDILVLRRLERVESALADGALLVLTPHLNAPITDDKFPDELAVMRSGTFNCGFVAIHAAHPASGALIDWWSRKLEFDCFVDLEAGLFTDQKWMDLAPGLFPDVHILRDSGYNLAYWNLAQRPVTQDPDGGYRAGGAPLVFTHFSGVQVHEPATFSKHQDRFTRDTIGGLRPLYDHYLELLRANGHAIHRAKPYAYGCFADGEPINEVLRRAYHRYFDVFCEQAVLHPQGMDRELFNQPAPELADVPGLPISRVMYQVWRMREDLRDAFSLRNNAGRDGYIRWYLYAVADDARLPKRYIQPIRARFDAKAGSCTEATGRPAAVVDGTTKPEADAPPAPSAGEPAPARDAPAVDAPRAAAPPSPLPRTPSPSVRARVGGALLHAFVWGKRHGRLARLYYRIPFRWRLAVRQRVHAAAGMPMPPLPFDLARRRAARARRRAHQASRGLNLLGYARGEFGIAENVRSYARALEAAGYPFSILNFDVGVASRQDDHSMDGYFSDQLPYTDNVYFINADQMPIAHGVLGRRAFGGHRNIGFWVWELERFPADWHGAFDLVDEVWVPTAYVRDAIGACTPKPVLRMPKAIEFDPPVGLDRAHFGLPDDAFVFLFSYDFNGFVARKHPDAVIAAFRQAFASETRPVRLLVKSVNGSRFPDKLAELAQSVADDPRIEVRDGFLSREEMFGLQNAVDCYVSLHRAEGFGLGMAESMYLGKPVIATGYSGNLDFMDARNSLLVDYRLVPVGDGQYPYWRGQRWADPEVGHAARLMRQVFEDREAARRIGGAAAESIRRTNSKAVCAESVMQRLGTIHRLAGGV